MQRSNWMINRPGFILCCIKLIIINQNLFKNFRKTFIFYYIISYYANNVIYTTPSLNIANQRNIYYIAKDGAIFISYDLF